MMQYFFTSGGLSEVMHPNKKIALFLDYDGTLVPIRKDPAQCILSEKIKKQLRLLAGSNRCYLTILSGRSLSDIKKMVGLQNIYYGGNHGLDISGPRIRYTHPHALLTKPVIDKVKHLLIKEVKNIDGAWIEDKKFTISLHFRSVKKENISSVKNVLHRAAVCFCESESLSIIKGKKVLELAPSASWDKGRAALWILRQLKHRCLPIYIGDDQTDETAFKALRKQGITIRVGKSKKSAADFYLKGYWEVSRLLREILHFLNGRLP